MSKHLKFNGKVVDEYSPDNYSKIRTFELGYEYAYQVAPVTLTTLKPTNNHF